MEDYCSVETISDGWMKLYDMGPAERKKLGQKAKAYADSEFNYEDVIDSWHNTLNDTYDKFHEKTAKWSLQTL